MGKKVLIIQGHPDPEGKHFGRALAEAYARGAGEAGHEVRVIEVAKLDFPLLRRKEEFEQGTPPKSIEAAQKEVLWADHLVIFFPLWLGTMPALLKGFFEQLFRYGFALGKGEEGKMARLLKGRSARIAVTMGMPAFIYRWYFGAHGVKVLKRSILHLSGIGPIKENLIGMIEGSQAGRERWLRKMYLFGREGR